MTKELSIKELAIEQDYGTITSEQDEGYITQEGAGAGIGGGSSNLYKGPWVSIRVVPSL